MSQVDSVNLAVFYSLYHKPRTRVGFGRLAFLQTGLVVSNGPMGHEGQYIVNIKGFNKGQGHKLKSLKQGCLLPKKGIFT